jgi:Ran GTPase-activating protein (RanGAP) involved in mRNA processing and transport
MGAMSHCSLGSLFGILKTKSKLTNLSLLDMGINDNTLNPLLRMLADLPNLEVLNLWQNKLSASGLERLSSCLEQTPHALKELNVIGNPGLEE